MSGDGSKDGRKPLNISHREDIKFINKHKSSDLQLEHDAQKKYQEEQKKKKGNKEESKGK
jgi:hypothetical protein